MDTTKDRFPPVGRIGAQVLAMLAVTAGRAAGALARRLGRGGGTSLPGKLAYQIDPDILRYLARQLRHGSVVLTGTNGKTTTSGMTASALRAAGIRVWRNREGANLVQGIAAALVIRSTLMGRLRWHGDAAAVLEVDEAAFPAVVRAVRPRIIVVTNVFRDQLDRYGEIDTVLTRWATGIRSLPSETQLVLNADDPSVASLATVASHLRVTYFGLESALPDRSDEPADTDVVDTRTCPVCAAPLSVSLRLYSHLGHWACSACGFARPLPDVIARDITSTGMQGSAFTCVIDGTSLAASVPLPGVYNVYNAIAAVAACHALGVPPAVAVEAIARFEAAFGRGERIQANGRQVRLLLAKNPTGMNEVLRVLAAESRPHLLLLLNDRFADGEDVSWIWDARFELLAPATPASITVSGTRAYDLAVRLKYAGISPVTVDPSMTSALDRALAATPAGETLYVVPTYTALLDVRGVLERRGYTTPFWEPAYAH